jgi:hypothetical protein
MASSTCSSVMSETSVIWNGEETDLETCVDETFKLAQQHMNGIHVQIRELAQVPERNEDYLTALDIYLELEKDINGLADIFKELKKVSKSVLGSPPKELKSEVASRMAKWKTEMAVAKQRQKEELANKKEEQKS